MASWEYYITPEYNRGEAYRISVSREEVRCLYCGESFVFVAGTHLKREDHFGDSNAFERYKRWVAKEHDLDPGHEVFHTPGALTRAEEFQEYRDLFE